MSGEQTLDLRFPECLAADFPRELPAAERAVARVLGAVGGASFDRLVERSPGLKENDWTNYLRCSIACMVHAANAVARLGVSSGRLLDYGAYFANFAVMFAALGFDVDAADFYRAYEPALGTIVAELPSAGVRPIDFDEIGRDLAGVPDATYDVVLCMGVVEHIPHTPRMLLESLDRVMKPGGVLLLETPNLAHLYNRQKLARGEPILTSMPIQYYASVPFEGHHREYTVDEAVWMVQQLGHTPVSVELFNYSSYGQGSLSGRDVTNHWRMVADPTLRELMLVVSRKPLAGETRADPVDWRSIYVDREAYWQAQAPAPVPAEDADAIVSTERLLVELQEAVRVRDEMLKALQAERVQEVERRDREIAGLNERLGELQRAFDATPGERVKRALRRATGRTAGGDGGSHVRDRR